MIKYVVEEPQETEHSKLTADQILEKAHFAPKHFYLVEIRGRERISYEGRGHEEVHLHDGLKFIAIHIGPTPVSELPAAGVARFVAELQNLGFAVQQGADGQVTFDYEVDMGKQAGRKVIIGVAVPPNFPLSPPSGIHVSPHVHRIQPTGQHPTGGINASPFGAGFQYWSRPFNDWGNTRRRVADYIAFVRQLWATQ